MKFSRISNADAALCLSLLLAPLPVAAMFRCNHIVSDGQQYDLGKLGGPHSVVMSWVDGEYIHNTTYTVDICTALKRSSDVKPSDQCPLGTRVCAIKRLIKPDEKLDTIEKTTPISGDLAVSGGGHLDPVVSQLSKIDPESDKKGLQVILKGGYRTTESGIKRKQSTVIKFVCDKDREGTEGEYDPEDKYVSGDEAGDGAGNERLRARADGDNEEDPPSKEVQLGLENDPSLLFDSYGPSDSDAKVDVLHLTWSTKYVCQSKADDGSDDGSDGGSGGGGDGDDGDEPKKSSSHWGAFTWILILVFFGTAAYLIFGSWLNYNRYGARGWDLLPHGDTIREIPYLLKDWVRRVLNTVQGSGSRGGYSAV